MREFCSNLDKILVSYANGRYPLGVSILRTAPIAKSDASVSSWYGFRGSGYWRSGADVSRFFSSRKFFSHLKFHSYGAFFFRSAVRGAISLLQLGMNFLTKATIPKNDCELVIVLGQFKLFMAAIFLGLGLMPSPLIACPNKVRLF